MDVGRWRGRQKVCSLSKEIVVRENVSCEIICVVEL